MAARLNQDGTSSVTLATLDTQVKSLDRDYQDIKHSLVGLNTKVDTSLASLGSKFENAIAGLSTKIDQRATTQWPTIFGGFGSVFMLLSAMGWMAYNPIQRDTARLDAAVVAILDRGVFQRSYDADQTRTAELLKGLRSDVNTNIQQQRYNTDQERLTSALDDMRSRFAPKSEMEALFRERQTQITTNTANIELLRLRSYADIDRVSRVEQASKDSDRRIDAISQRLAEFIRDMGKH